MQHFTIQRKHSPWHFQKQEFQHTSFETKPSLETARQIFTRPEHPMSSKLNQRIANKHPRRFRTAPILSTWTVSRWPNSHGSIPWWTEEANLRHPTLKCHVSVWGCKQTPVHVLLPAWGEHIVIIQAVCTHSQTGLLFASQTQMNDLKLLADDAHVFPNLNVYLGDSCDTDEPLYCWKNTSPSSNLTQFLPNQSWCPLSQPRQRQKVGV